MNHLQSKSDREHSFDIELATIVGLEKAILLKNIAYWCRENRRREIQLVENSEVYWTEESVRSLADKYPYFKRTSINRWMTELHNDGWLRVMGVLGGKNLYSPGPVFITWDAGGDWKNTQREVLSQNGTPPGLSQNGTPLSQNGTPTVPKWDTMCPKMGHLYYSNIVTNVEEYSNTRPQAEKTTKKVTAAPGGGKSASLNSEENQTGFKGGARRGAAGAGRAGEMPDLPYHLSEWATATDEQWRDALAAKTNYPNIDAHYYRQRVQLWSEQKEKTSKNWLATAAAFAVDDNLKNKLVTQKEQGHDQLIRNPLSGHLTTVANVNRAARAAERYLARQDSNKPT